MGEKGMHEKEHSQVIEKHGSGGMSRKRTLRQIVSAILSAVLFLAVCFLLITPLRSCTLSEKGYIGEEAALTVALGNAGISADSADSPSSELIRVDGKYCYKVGFNDYENSYSYIIDAANGNLVASYKKPLT